MRDPLVVEVIVMCRGRCFGREERGYGIEQAVIYSAVGKEGLEIGEWEPLSHDEAAEWSEDEPRLYPAAVLNLHHMMSMPKPEWVACPVQRQCSSLS